jgi:heme-degrading monooxygenase HmoA
MPISMTQSSPGMPATVYDEIIAHLAEPLRGSEGFVSHAAEITPDGVTVTEVWESREHWERWHTASVKPHLPADAPEPTITELHNALAR